MHERALLACGSFLVVAGVTTGALAADVYVDAAAAAGGDGSAAMPLLEIQAGLDLAQPGDTVHVAPGTYSPIQTVRAGEANARITVLADRRRTAIVQASGTGLRNQHPYHTYQGLVFDGGYGAGDLVLGDGGDHAEFVDVEVRRSGRDCFDLRNVTDVMIGDSYIHHCVAIGGDGAIVDAHGVTGDSVFDLTIRGTEIGMASGDSLQLSPPREPWGNVLVEGCVLWTAPLDEAEAGAAVGTPMGENAVDTKVGPDGDGTGANPRLEIRDTIAYGFNGFIGNQAAFNLKENVDAYVDGVTIYDTEVGFRLRFPAVIRIQNAVVHSVDNAVRYEDGLVGAEIVSSTIGGGIGADVFEDGGGGGGSGFVLQNLLVLGEQLPDLVPAESNMATGPEVFVDAAGHDYHLVEGAAPIDAGEALAQVTSDRDGVARPYGAGHDIGAYEWDPNAPAGDSSGADDDGPGGDDGVGDGTGQDGDGTGGGGGDDDGSAAGEDAGPDDGTGGGSGSGAGEDSGCSCRTDARTRAAGLVAFVAIAIVRRRRQKK